MKPETWLQTLNCAVEGLLHAVRSQRHVRWHAFAGLAVLILAPLTGVSPAEFALLCLAAAAVLVAELLNTALEAAVDLACPEVHPLAKVSKDVAAAAVLVAAFAAAAVGWVVFFPKLGRAVERGLVAVDEREPVAFVAALLVVLVAVVVLKALWGRGTPLHGGFPSGHSAVSFSLATLLALRSRDPVVAAVGGLLALMVSHSRLLLRVHTRSEVAAGSALGVALGALLYWLLF
jgi:diacylglycerol kinase (ATP)